MRRPIPVWGFPTGYNPNLMGDRCERCRQNDNWVGRTTQVPDLVAWSCRCFAQQDQQNNSEIPD